MKELKSGLGLIIAGNVLYIVYIFFANSLASTMGDFMRGVILGLSIGINLLGIILTAISVSKLSNK